MEFFATCPKGFERLLADELAALGCSQVRPLKGQVSFVGEAADAYRACLWTRLASRVMLVLGRVDATSSDTLYEGLRALDWDAHVGQGATLVVDAHGTNEALRNTQFVALRSKDAIMDSLMARRGVRPMVDTRNPDLTIAVRVTRQRATVALDLSGEPLFRRGYESAPGRRAPIAPLRPDYAAALLAAGGWTAACRRPEGSLKLVALHAGAGTVLAEGAAVALDRAPGLARQRWGFAGWAAHDETAWDVLLADARERAEAGERELELVAYEGRRGSATAVRQLLRAAGMDVDVSFVEGPEELGAADLVVSDLSWLPADEPVVQVDVLTATRALLDATYAAPLVTLTRANVDDGAAGRALGATLELFVGQDDAVARVYEAAEELPERPAVQVGGERVAVQVAASDQFAARLAKVAKLRAKWARREDVSCYRVYDADLPDYAVTIDLFEESVETVRERPRRWLQVYEYAPPRNVDPALAQGRLLDVLAIAPRVLGVDPRDVFVRTRQKAKGGSQYADEAKAARPGRGRMVAGAELVPGAHLIDEGGLVFEVNFSTRLDCGIFLDHRDTRAMLREMAKQTLGSKRFLNLFAYTGTGTCYAADGGMRHTTTVDLSGPSLAWARRNMARNGFTGPEHEFVQADVIAWISEQRRTANRWDLVFCDVPTFSNSARMRSASFDVQRDHAELLIGVSRLLTRPRDGHEGGVCVFSCNLRGFKPDVEKLAKAGVQIEDITERTIPEDFARNKRVHHCYLVRRV